jgi:two-component sensor histidine kinase
MLSHTDALKIRLAVQEAVLNGLEHGNLELDSQWKEELSPDGRDKFSSMRKRRLADPAYADRSVTVNLVYGDGRLEITVRDEGKGFLNARGVPDSCKVDSLSCSGRGLALMSSAVDEVQFGENGSEVTMIKRLHERKSTEDYGS